MQFNIEAANRNTGADVQLTIEAASKDEAMQRANEMGFIVASISQSPSSPHGAPQESKKECDWCRESIRIDALKCPHCRKWRKDIQEDINGNIRWAVYAISCVVVALLITGGAAHKGVWFETNSWGGSGDFSLKRFLSSESGWFVLFCYAGCAKSWVMSLKYLKSARRKTGGGLREI